MTSQIRASERALKDAVKRQACQHDYRYVGSYGGEILVYECAKCGDEYEKDVS